MGSIPSAHSHWHSLRSGVMSDDTIPTATYYDPTDFDIGISTEIEPWTAMLLRCFGRDANNETATLKIVLWQPDAWGKETVGPGIVAWDGTLTLGSNNLGGGSTAVEPFPGWGSQTNWFEVDTWDDTDGHNFAVGTVLTGGSQSCLLLPTLGAKFVTPYIAGTGGMAEVCLMGYPISADGVI